MVRCFLLHQLQLDHIYIITWYCASDNGNEIIEMVEINDLMHFELTLLASRLFPWASTYFIECLESRRTTELR